MIQHLERLDLCHPIIQRSAHELILRCKAELKRDLFVVRGWSTLDEQMKNYQKGRVLDKETGEWEPINPVTLAGIVTRAKPGTSAHNIVRITGGSASMAFDVIPFNEDGSLDWDVENDFWDELYPIAWKVGLDPLGDQIGAYLKGDMGHFEEPCYKLKMEALGCMYPLLKGSEV